jgi:hypothetical protein
MSNKLKFDVAKAGRIIRIITEVTDRKGQVRNMREALAAEYKGFPRKMLSEAEYSMLRDAAVKQLEARDTVGEKSVGPMATNQAKTARCMPIILGIPADKLGDAVYNYEKLAALSTQIVEHKGNAEKALHAFLHRKKDYKKSLAAHFKAILGMNDGKFLTPKQKGAVVEAAAVCNIELS